MPLPSLLTECGKGLGLAACPALGLLVTSDKDKNTLLVWGLPGGASGGGGASAEAGGGGGAPAGGGGGLRLVCTIGGDGSAAPMQFKFSGGGGRLAFTSPSSDSTSHPLLLATDAGHSAVHLVDVVGRTHAGYVAPPGSIAGPRGVAASGILPLVAVSAWKEFRSGDHVVVVYRGSGSAWEAVRVIGGGFGSPGSRQGQLSMPHGLRFSRDGHGICVADWSNGRASVFRVGNGGFVRHTDVGLVRPCDVEEVEGGWLVACGGSHLVEFVGDGDDGGAGGRPSLGEAGGEAGRWGGEFRLPVALAVVPGLGLVVREHYGRLQVFATPDTIAMAAMSHVRVAWMGAVARTAARRR